MITFGGDDLRNLTPKILETLKNEKYIFHVVIGEAFKHVSYIHEYASHPNIKFYFNLTAKEVLKLMLTSDIVISACGQTLHELARVGVPTIGIVVTKNQELNAEYFQRFGFLMYTEKYTDNNLEKNIFKTLKLFNYKKRKLCSKIGRKFVDGLGAKRIVSKISTIYNI